MSSEKMENAVSPENEREEVAEFSEEDVLEVCYRVCNGIRKYFFEGKLDIDDDEYESIRYYLQEDLIDDDDDNEVCVKVCETSVNMQKELKQIQAQVQKT
ncbi:MAG: hypothetical protein QXP36_10725 [Conexivisphaerales archaeon]